MAKKTSRRVLDEVPETVEVALEAEPAEERAVEETAPVRTKARVGDDAGGTVGNVSLSDIRKAVAFVNSTGGLEKALNLLQILKVAREVQ